jgi:hypothetical protein
MIVFSEAAATKIKRATERVLNSPPSRTGERTRTTQTEGSFWGLITGPSIDGMRYSFVRVFPVLDNDSRQDFKLMNGAAYRIADTEPEAGLARESNGNKGVPTYTVVMMHFIGYDAADTPAYLFQWIGPNDMNYLRPHDHRSNDQGGFAFSVYHPGTGLPQQPFGP